MFTTHHAFSRSWFGLPGLPEGFVITARLDLLGRAVLLHGPSPGPGQPGT